MDNLHLIYIHEVGEDWDGEYIYQFLFSDKTEGIDGDYWDLYPASGRPTPPPKNFILLTGTLKSQYSFDVLQNSDSHAMWDGTDGALPLAMENISEYEEYPNKRMYFRFGILKSEVDSILYQNDLILINKKNE